MIYYKTYSFDNTARATEAEKALALQLRNYVIEQAFELSFGIKFTELELKRNKYGKPFVGNNMHFNISHTRGLVCCAVSEVPVGVDAELVRPINAALINKICSCKEKEALLSSADTDLEFFKYWTLKESYVKMLGIGLSFPLNKINFSFSGGKPIGNAANAAFDLVMIDHWTLALCRQDNICKADLIRL